MTEVEMIALIGELIAVEIDDTNRVEYQNQTSLLLVMENGQRFRVEVNELPKN